MSWDRAERQARIDLVNSPLTEKRNPFPAALTNEKAPKVHEFLDYIVYNHTQNHNGYLTCQGTGGCAPPNSNLLTLVI